MQGFGRRFVLRHLSDIHVWDEDFIGVKSMRQLVKHWRDFKRYQGYLNLKYARGPDTYSVSVLQEALRHIVDQQRNESRYHLIISGDLTNLSLPSEFELARKLIQENYLDPVKQRFKYNDSDTWRLLSAVPGNHDVYVPESVDEDYFGKYFSDTFVGDSKRQKCGSLSPSSEIQIPGFPFIKFLPETRILLYCMNSAVPTRPFVSGGVIRDSDLETLHQMSQEFIGEEKDKENHVVNAKVEFFKVLIMHHPPVARHKSTFAEMLHGITRNDKNKIAQFCEEEGIDLLLHGHTHHPYFKKLENTSKTLVCEAGSGTYALKNGKYEIARYNSYEIEANRLVGAYTSMWNPENQTFDKKTISWSG